MKKILVINGHPVEGSFGAALAQAYIKGAESGQFHIEVIHVRQLNFNPNLMFGYKKRMELEPDIEDAIHKICNADHLVWVYPMWWYGMPAILKGFVDRTFLSGITYKSRPGKLPEKLLKGKTARIIITADTPQWFDILYMRSPAINQLKKGILQFCGVSPVKVSFISPINTSDENFRQKWLRKIEKLGMNGK